MIHYRAPGKAVIWGEYAVLEGAPALVMAVDRYASTRIESTGERWRCEAKGFAGVEEVSAAQLLSGVADDSTVMGVVSAAVAAAVAATDAPTLPDAALVMTEHPYQRFPFSGHKARHWLERRDLLCHLRGNRRVIGDICHLPWRADRPSSSAGKYRQWAGCRRRVARWADSVRKAGGHSHRMAAKPAVPVHLDWPFCKNHRSSGAIQPLESSRLGRPA